MAPSVHPAAAARDDWLGSDRAAHLLHGKVGDDALRDRLGRAHGAGWQAALDHIVKHCGERAAEQIRELANRPVGAGGRGG